MDFVSFIPLLGPDTCVSCGVLPLWGPWPPVIAPSREVPTMLTFIVRLLRTFQSHSITSIERHHLPKIEGQSHDIDQARTRCIVAV